MTAQDTLVEIGAWTILAAGIFGLCKLIGVLFP